MANLAESIPALRYGAKLGLRNLQGAGLMTFGNIFFVNSATGSDTANTGKDEVQPFATIGAAISASTASNGDVVIVMPHHAETVTTAIAASKAGLNIIGLGAGNQRPTITGNGTIDAVSISGAGTVLENIRFAAPGTTAQTADIDVSAAGVTIRNTYHIGSQTSKYKVDSITVASGGDDLLVDGVRGYNTVVITNTSFLSLEAAVARFEMKNCYIAGEFATGALMDEATATLAYIHDNIIKNVTAAVAVVTFTTGNSTGVCANNFFSGRHTTIASNIVEGTGMDWVNNYVVEQPALSGLLEPAVDAD